MYPGLYKEAGLKDWVAKLFRRGAKEVAAETPKVLETPTLVRKVTKGPPKMPKVERAITPKDLRRQRLIATGKPTAPLHTKVTKGPAKMSKSERAPLTPKIRREIERRYVPAARQKAKEQASKVLEEARQQGLGVQDRALEDAIKLLEEAKAEAAIMRARAQEQARNVLARAKEEARQHVLTKRQQAENLLLASKRRAEKITREAMKMQPKGFTKFVLTPKYSVPAGLAAGGALFGAGYGLGHRQR